MSIKTYPNIQERKKCDPANRGILFEGRVEVNDETMEKGIAGLQAAVTRELIGYTRIYAWLPEFGWAGPFMLKSEEVQHE